MAAKLMKEYDVFLEFKNDKLRVEEKSSPNIASCINRLLEDATFYKDIDDIANILIEFPGDGPFN